MRVKTSFLLLLLWTMGRLIYNYTNIRDPNAVWCMDVSSLVFFKFLYKNEFLWRIRNMIIQSIRSRTTLIIEIISYPILCDVVESALMQPFQYIILKRRGRRRNNERRRSERERERRKMST